MPQTLRRLGDILILACLIPQAAALNILQWNPHWQCFESGNRTCERHAEQTLDQVLTERDVEFANVVELGDPTYALPPGFAETTKRCGVDVTTLIWDQRRWVASPKADAARSGCMAAGDRPFIVQHFDEHEAYGRRKLVVVGAHYPHGVVNSELEGALAFVVNATNVSTVVLIADTNLEGHVSNSEVMDRLGAPEGPTRGTQLLPSCCYNVHDTYARGFHWPLTYDRVVTNFGPSMSTEMLLDPLPPWAKVGELHKPVLALDGPSITSTTSTTTRTFTSSTSTTSTVTTTPMVVAVAVAEGLGRTVFVFLIAFGAFRLFAYRRSEANGHGRDVLPIAGEEFISVPRALSGGLSLLSPSDARLMVPIPVHPRPPQDARFGHLHDARAEGPTPPGSPAGFPEARSDLNEGLLSSSGREEATPRWHETGRGARGRDQAERGRGLGLPLGGAPRPPRDPPSDEAGRREAPSLYATSSNVPPSLPAFPQPHTEASENGSPDWEP